jgi:hypothetical protein
MKPNIHRNLSTEASGDFTAALEAASRLDSPCPRLSFLALYLQVEFNRHELSLYKNSSKCIASGLLLLSSNLNRATER